MQAGAVPSASGIYRIVCTANGGKVYVGSAVNLRRRFASHKNTLSTGTHHNRHLQNAWNKYGEAAFRFEVVEIVPRERLVDVEQAHLNACEDKFNIRPEAHSNLGVKHSRAMREKCAAAARGRKHTDAARARMSLAAKGRGRGRRASEEARANMSLAATRRMQRPDLRMALGDRRRGATVKTETREKLRAAWDVLTPEQRKARSEAMWEARRNKARA